MSKKYSADESVSNDAFHLEGEELSQIMKVIDPMIRDFCAKDPLTRWVNITFSADGVTTRNIAISQD